MGNRITRVRSRAGRTVEERFTTPHRLVRQPSNVDYKKLRKLILSEKLAPCFDGVEDSNPDLEECPICFFFYPSLNRSRCCMKGICTECFLQLKPSNAMDRPTQCPFCKFSSYAIEFRGAKTKEEKSLEQAEEQKVIEAKIRMLSQDMDRVTLAEHISSDVEAQPPVSHFGPLPTHNDDASERRDSEGAVVDERTGLAQSQDQNVSDGRHEEFDLDLEDIMMTEAIWRSIQDLDQSRGASGTSEPGSLAHRSDQCGPSSAFVDQKEVSSAESSTTRLAIAIARMAECNIQRSEMLQLIRENNDETSQTIDEAEPGGACVYEEPNEECSENGCLESCCSTTEDESWGSLAARILDENPSLESEFSCDGELVTGADDDESCSLSSVHSLSDGCGENSDCSDDGARTSCSHLSASFSFDQPIIMVSHATA